MQPPRSPAEFWVARFASRTSFKRIIASSETKKLAPLAAAWRLGGFLRASSSAGALGGDHFSTRGSLCADQLRQVAEQLGSSARPAPAQPAGSKRGPMTSIL